jgi:hypothetical protein
VFLINPLTVTANRVEAMSSLPPNLVLLGNDFLVIMLFWTDGLIDNAM